MDRSLTKMLYDNGKSLFIVCYNNDNFGDDLLKLYYLNENNNNSLFLNAGLYKKKFLLNKKKILVSLLKLIKSQDICFIGGIFQDYSSQRSLLFYLFILGVSSIFSKKIYILSSTFEIKSSILQNLFIKILKYASNKNLIKIIEVRDSNSFQLIKNLNCNKRKIKDPYDKYEGRYNRQVKYAFIEDIKVKNNLNNKILDLFNVNLSNFSVILIFSINKSYQNKENKILIKKMLSEAKASIDNLLFIISDPKDFDFIMKSIKDKNLTYHIAKISQRSLHSLIEFIGNFEIKIMYTERLHILLILKKFVDLFIINGNKIVNYLKSWNYNEIIKI